MSIAALGAGISTLFNIIHQVTAPPAPATPAAPVTPPPLPPRAPDLNTQLRQKIQTAVTAALQDPANAATDPDQIIQQAITDVLQGKSPPASANPLDPQTQQAQFDALLHSHGVDPSQFQADFKTALAQAAAANGGTLDLAKIFKTSPPGTTLNTVA